MFNKSFFASMVFGIAALAGFGSPAHAQYGYPPGVGQFAYGSATPGQLMMSNIAFDQQFDQWAWQMSKQVAASMRPGEKLPFNAMTISNSINQGNQAFYGYMQSVQQNSNRQSQAVGNWTTGAIQGNWYYGQGGNSPYYVLPYTQNAYYVQGGYAYPGYSPYGTNIYPVYPRR